MNITFKILHLLHLLYLKKSCPHPLPPPPHRIVPIEARKLCEAEYAWVEQNMKTLQLYFLNKENHIHYDNLYFTVHLRAENFQFKAP